LWAGAAIVASAGYGFAIERAAKLRLPPALTVASGLAALLVIATALAHGGVLVDLVGRGLVGAGLALAAFPREAPSTREPCIARFYYALGGIAAITLVVIALVRLDVPLVDGTNHVLATKRLWDTGALEPLASSSGLPIVGGALFTLGGTADAMSWFGDGVCAALLLAIITPEIARCDDMISRLAFVLAVGAIVVEPPGAGEMPAMMLHTAAFFALRRAPQGRTAWHALVLAIALALVRNELAFLAVPYAVGAVVLPRFERVRGRPTTAFVGWFAAAFAIQLALGAPGGLALVKSLALLAALPIGIAVLHMLGTFRMGSAYGVMCWAVTTFMLAVAIYAVHPRDHSPMATFVATYGAAFALLADLPSLFRMVGNNEVRLRIGTVSVAIALFASGALIMPGVQGGSSYLARRLSFATVALHERMLFGSDAAHEDVHAVQLLAPEGARIVFWGKSAARLDFARNPIRDISFTKRKFLVPIAPTALGGAEYLILEDLHPVARKRPDKRTERVAAIADIELRLEPVATVRTARLFRVRR
jgi:hypothetical protein